MSLVTKVSDLATRIGTEFKTVRTEIAALNTDDIAEGTTNKYLTDERVEDIIGSKVQGGSNVTVSYNDSTGVTTVSAASGYTTSSFNTDFATKTTDNLSEGTTNKYFTSQRALDATASAYDAAGAAASAQSAAQTYADGLITNLVNGAPATLDTLNELASALGSDANYSTTISTALGNRVRVDAAQSLNSTQKAQGRDNIGAASASDVGDTTTNFVSTFEAALV